MRKLIVLALAAAASLALIQAKALSTDKVSKAQMVAPSAIDKDFSAKDATIGMFEAGTFDKSANGYGWYNNGNRKTSYAPNKDSWLTTFRKLVPGTSGGWGNRAGSWGEWVDDVWTPATGKLGARYPATCATQNYNIAVTMNNGATSPSSPIMKIYDASTQTFGNTIEVPGVTACWVPTIGAVEKPNGDLVVTIISEEGANSNALKLLVGVSSNQGVSFTWATPIEFTYTGNNLQQAFGKDGFGIMACTAQRYDVTEEDYALSWIYTTDYGITWNWKDAATHEMFQIKDADLIPWLGKPVTYTVAGVPTVGTIDYSGLTYDFNVTVNPLDNSVHFADLITGGRASGTGYVPEAFSDDNTPIHGFYDIVGTMAGGTFTWTPKFIAHRVGWLESDAQGTDGTMELEDIPGRTAIGWAKKSDSQGILFMTALDRPHATLDEMPFHDTGSKYFSDGFTSWSLDNGNTWITDFDAASGIKNLKPLTNTPLKFEEGFNCPQFGKYDATTDELQFITSWQFADMTSTPNPNPAALMADYQQELYMGLVKITKAGINITQMDLDKNFALAQNYPNPFNPTTSINFNLKDVSSVKLAVYNVKGEMVQELVNSKLNSGMHTFNFDGSKLNSGVYFYQLNVNGLVETKKMVLTK